MVGLMKTDYDLEDLSYEECSRPLEVGSGNTNEPEGVIVIDTIHTPYYN